VHRLAACALGALALGIGPCNLTELRSDVNADGWVDGADEALVETCIGPPPGSLPICARADVIFDGVVDQRDLDAVRSYLGEALFTPASPPFVPTDVELGDEVLYLHAQDRQQIYRWSLAAGHWLKPIYIDPGARHIAYSEAHRRLYVAYASGAIQQIDADLPIASAPFATVRAVPDGLAAAGSFLFASDASGIAGTHYTFASDGAPVSAAETRWYSSALAWSEASGRMYYFRDPLSPNDLLFDSIDPGTGEIRDAGESPYHGDFEIAGPIRVSRDGTRVLLGSGDIYAAPDLTYEASLAFGPIDAVWLGDGDLLTLSATEGGGTLLRHWTADLALRNLQTFAGLPLRVFTWEGGFAVVTIVDGLAQVHTYVPTNDADGDGVANAADAFPLDPAASLDTDGDHHPDAWNPGKGPQDSTTGLQLDAFPYDSACQLPEQGRAGQPNVCDIARAVPIYTPSRIEVDAAGTLYLLSPENDRVYRWSLDDDAPMNPIDIGQGATQIAYSTEHGRLYVGYASGEITRIDLGASFPREAHFTTMSQGITGLQAMGQFMLAAYPRAGFQVHSVLRADGTPASTYPMGHLSHSYDWNPVNHRLYFARDDNSPNDLLWESFDPQSGALTGLGDSPYHGDYAIQHPIRVSSDGARVLLGSGDIYDGITLQVLHSLPHGVADGAWTSAGLVTVRSDGAGTVLEHWNPDYTLFNQQILAGDALRVVQSRGEIVVVTRVAGRPVFQTYVPAEDGDGDGVPTKDDAFPLDPAASRDRDHDGYPDAWNPGYGPEDSTEGLVLDAFPDDFACQLPEHGIGGVCDFAYVLPQSPTDPFCEQDTIMPAQTSGWLELGATGDFVPLCDGWLIIGDKVGARIAIRNAVNGRVGAYYPLPSAPGDLELDENGKALYVALPAQNALARLDLLTGNLQLWPVSGPISSLAIGPDGGLFVAVDIGSGVRLSWLAAGASAPVGSWFEYGRLIRWNATANELLIAAVRGGSPMVARYAFVPASGPSLLQMMVDSYSGEGRDLAISSDGLHLAYAATTGNGGDTYSIRDFVPNDLTTYRGVWHVTGYTYGAAFDRASQRLLASDETGLKLFDVTSFAQLHSLAFSSCSTRNPDQVAFSRGGSLAFGKVNCGNNSSASRYHWFVTPAQR